MKGVADNASGCASKKATSRPSHSADSFRIFCLRLVTERQIMKQRFRLYRRKRGGRFYVHDNVTGRQESLKTIDRTEALRVLHAKNEADKQPAINLQIARAYLAGHRYTYMASSDGRSGKTQAGKHKRALAGGRP